MLAGDRRADSPISRNSPWQCLITGSGAPPESRSCHRLGTDGGALEIDAVGPSSQGVRMKTLSRGLAGRNPPGGLVETGSADFPDPDGLSRSMAAARVPCNTYFSLLEEPVGG